MAKYWWMFAAANLPVTAYFVKNARTEQKENRRLEEEYLRRIQETGQSEMSGFEMAMAALEAPVNRRPMVNTGLHEEP